MARSKTGTHALGATLILAASVLAGCSSASRPASAPPPAATSNGALRLGETVVLGDFAGSFDGVNFEVHPVGVEDVAGTRAPLATLVSLDAGTFGSTGTPSGANYVAMKQIGVAMRVGGTTGWDSANCGGAAPTSGTCVQMSMVNMFAQYELIHPYVQMIDITSNPTGTPITFNTNAATDAAYGVSAAVGLMRYPDRIAPAGTTGLDSAIKYWTFRSSQAAPLTFSFHFKVLARITDPIIRSSLVNGTSDLSPYAGGTSGGSNSGTGAFPVMGPVRIDLSTDGRYTAFQSQNDLAGTGTTTLQVYVRDNVAGTTALASRTSTGALPSTVLPAGCQSSSPAMAASGGYVAFLSRCRLDPADTDNVADVYLYNVSTGTTSLASVDFNGANSTVAMSNSIVGVSDDGNRVAFSANGAMVDQFGSSCTGQNVWVYDATAALAIRISGPGAGDATCPNGNSNQPVMDQLGDFVAYSSVASNLVAGDSNGCADIFLYDINGDTTTRVSLNESGAELTGSCASNNPALSADATHVAWDTRASNILGANGISTHVYAATIGSPSTVVRGDQTAAGVQGSSNASFPSLSGEGRIIGFLTSANLDPLDGNGSSDAYVRDTGTPDAAFSGAMWSSTSKANATSLLSITLAPMLSHDGNYIAFYGSANLVNPSPNVTHACRAPAR